MKFILAIFVNLILSCFSVLYFGTPLLVFTLFPLLIATVLHLRPSKAFVAAFLGQILVMIIAKYFPSNFVSSEFQNGIIENGQFSILPISNINLNATLVGFIAGFFALIGTAIRQTQIIMAKILFVIYSGVYFFIITPALIGVALYVRFFRKKKKIDIGLGPEPMINNVYHKRALESYGYTAETFVDSVYFITKEFDYRGDLLEINKSRVSKHFFLLGIWLFIRSIVRYKALYIYFNGGPLKAHYFLRPIEPFLYKIAGTKIVVMPYGGDVHDLTHCPNLQFKHAMAVDYPSYYKMNGNVRRQIVRWTNYSDFVLSGCDWVDYTYHWDMLTLAHFSIDLDKFTKLRETNPVYRTSFTKEKPLRILHAPNHKTIKGSYFIQKAVAELQNEGYPLELILLQGRSNQEILEEIAKADIIADQLVIGWYAMFALESLVLAKPVICYLREDLINLYLFGGQLSSKEEIPFLNTDVFGITDLLRNVVEGKVDLESYGSKGFSYVQKYHSISAIGRLFQTINQKIGIEPSLTSI